MELVPIETTTRRNNRERKYYYIIIPAQIAQFYELTDNTRIAFNIINDQILMQKANAHHKYVTKIRTRSFKNHSGKQYYLSIPAKISRQMQISKYSRFDLKPARGSSDQLFTLTQLKD